MTFNQPQQTPKISQDDLARWLANPITKTYLECINAWAQQRVDSFSKMGFLNLESSEKTMNNLYQYRGMVETINAINPQPIMNAAGVVAPYEVKEDENTE